MKDKRTRCQYRFWLDVTKAEEKNLYDQVQALKTARSFSTYVRDGLRLMISLSAGETDVLLELFPWVGKELGAGHVVEKNASASQMQELQGQVKYLEQLILAISAVSSSTPVTDPKPMAVPTFSMPQFDEDDGISQLIVAHKGDGSSAYNFSKSVMSLIQ